MVKLYIGLYCECDSFHPYCTVYSVCTVLVYTTMYLLSSSQWCPASSPASHKLLYLLRDILISPHQLLLSDKFVLLLLLIICPTAL